MVLRYKSKTHLISNRTQSANQASVAHCLTSLTNQSRWLTNRASNLMQPIQKEISGSMKLLILALSLQLLSVQLNLAKFKIPTEVSTLEIMPSSEVPQTHCISWPVEMMCIVKTSRLAVLTRILNSQLRFRLWQLKILPSVKDHHVLEFSPAKQS